MVRARRPAPALPQPARRSIDAARRWTHPVTHPGWAAACAALVASASPPGWAACAALVALWGEGRIWPDSRREWLSVGVGAVCVGATVPHPAAAAALSAALATVEVIVEHTDRGRSWERRRAIRDAWPALRDAIGATDVKLVDVDATRWRDRLTIRAPEGGLLASADMVAKRVASALHRAVDTVRVTPGAEAGSAVIEVSHGDPLAVAVPHPLPTSAPRGWRVPFGVDDRGRRVLFDLRVHALVAGMTGAGKSTAVQSVLLSARPLLASGRARLVIIDRKGGVEFGAWAEFADIVDLGARGDEGTAEALTRVRNEVDRRLSLMLGAGSRDWDHSDGPQLIVVLDEAAVVKGDALNVLGDIAVRGRAAGVTLIVGIQHPTVDNLPRLVATQLGQRIAMRVRDSAASRFLADGRPIDLTGLPLGGHCWLLADGRDRRARVYCVDDEMLPGRPAISGRGGYATERDPGTPTSTPDVRQAYARTGPRDGPAPAGAPERPDTAGLDHISARIVEACGWDDEPIGAVRERAGVSQRSWQRRAPELELAGLIQRDGRTVRLSHSGDNIAAADEREHQQ